MSTAKGKTKRGPELSALKGLIREKGSSYRKVSEKTGLGLNTVSDKINGYYSFGSDEIEKICEILQISAIDVAKYFFPRLVRS